MRPQETVERALELCTADGCVVILDETSSANLRWANNTLTTNGITHSRRLTVIATMEGGTGVAAGVVSRNGEVRDALETVVRAAESAAQKSPPSEDAQPLVAGGEAYHSWADPSIETSVGVFSGFAPSLGASFAHASAQGRLLFGYAEHTASSTYLASSVGLRLRHDQAWGHVEINGKSADLSTSAWIARPSSDFSDVDATALDAEIAQRLLWQQRRTELPAGRYETILPPSAVADLMGYMYWMAGARVAHEGRSVFSSPGGGTRVGERLTPVNVSLRSDPTARGIECAPFVVAHASSDTTSVFDNGLPLRPTDWIADGTLRALVQTRHSAQHTGLPITPRIGNLVMEAQDGGHTVQEMVAGTQRGLLLTSLFYIRQVDPQTLLLTGLTRDGVYLVEGGEVVGAVNNFRFNESPVDLLRRLSQVGATEQTWGRGIGGAFHTAMPPLRIPDFNMSSVSQAL